MRRPLILASTSRYRAALLARIGVPFEVEAPGTVEDTVAGEAASRRAERLALEKARAVAATHPQSWVLGSDQVADCAGRILDKPGDESRCREQLAHCSGRSVTFFTAVALIRGEPAAVSQYIDRTVVRFRSLSELEIARYVELERPFDCAGGFRCEGLGIALFDHIDCSDPTALVGLPLIWVAAALRAAGLDGLATVQP